jgi:hypothetical protein
MNRMKVLLIALGAIALGVTACSSNVTPTPTATVVPLGQKFVLALGQSQNIAGEDLSFKFIDVTEDSRCPLGAQCIQAGQAVCRLEATLNGQTSPLDLINIGPPEGMTSAEMGLYKIDFQLTPYPEVGQQIAKSDYRLAMTVTK